MSGTTSFDASTLALLRASFAPAPPNGTVSVTTELVDADLRRFTVPFMLTLLGKDKAGSDKTGSHWHWTTNDNLLSSTEVAAWAGLSPFVKIESADLLIEPETDSDLVSWRAYGATIGVDDADADEISIRKAQTFWVATGCAPFPGLPWASRTVGLPVGQFGISALLRPAQQIAKRPKFAVNFHVDGVRYSDGTRAEIKTGNVCARLSLVVVLRRSNSPL